MPVDPPALLPTKQHPSLRWIGLVAQPGTEDFYRRLGFRPLEGHVAMRLDPGVRR